MAKLKFSDEEIKQLYEDVIVTNVGYSIGLDFSKKSKGYSLLSGRNLSREDFYDGGDTIRVEWRGKLYYKLAAEFTKLANEKHPDGVEGELARLSEKVDVHPKGYLLTEFKPEDFKFYWLLNAREDGQYKNKIYMSDEPTDELKERILKNWGSDEIEQKKAFLNKFTDFLLEKSSIFSVAIDRYHGEPIYSIDISKDVFKHNNPPQTPLEKAGYLLYPHFVYIYTDRKAKENDGLRRNITKDLIGYMRGNSLDGGENIAKNRQKFLMDNADLVTKHISQDSDGNVLIGEAKTKDDRKFLMELNSIYPSEINEWPYLKRVGDDKKQYSLQEDLNAIFSTKAGGKALELKQELKK